MEKNAFNLNSDKYETLYTWVNKAHRKLCTRYDERWEMKHMDARYDQDCS